MLILVSVSCSAPPNSSDILAKIIFHYTRDFSKWRHDFILILILILVSVYCSTERHPMIFLFAFMSQTHLFKRFELLFQNTRLMRVQLIQAM